MVIGCRAGLLLSPPLARFGDGVFPARHAQNLPRPERVQNRLQLEPNRKRYGASPPEWQKLVRHFGVSASTTLAPSAQTDPMHTCTGAGH